MNPFPANQVRPNPVRRGENERGFALLIVFLLAAAMALMLYQQFPRVAFESQREKEQLLISRGEQYKRAIQLYFVAFKKYPSKIEDLENTNNKRYLRRRYIDPMTGKDEWRLIHVNAAGQLTDSQVTKPPALDDKNNSQSGTIGTNSGPLGANPATTHGTTTPATTSGTAAGTTAKTGTGTGAGTPADGPPDVNSAVLRRPSDRPMVPSTGLNQNPASSDPNDPRNWPPIFLQPAQGTPGAPATGQAGTGQPGTQPIPGQQAGQQPQQIPGQQSPGQQYPGQQYPGQQYAGQQNPGQQFPGQQFPGQTAIPGQFPAQNQLPGQNGVNPQQAAGQFNPVNPNQVVPIVPGSTVVPATGGTAGSMPGGGSNPAVGMINDMLRQPRATGDATSANNTPAVGGLAGVATSFKGPSIKIYKDRQKYNEWEFIFDLKQGMPGQQPAATPAGQGLANPGQGPTGPASSTPPATGTNPTTPQPNQP